MLLRASFRRRWRSWLLLCLLIALVSGLVLAATAAGRRTATAFPRYEAVHGYDAFLYSVTTLPKVATLPEVASATQVRIVGGGTPTCACSRPIDNIDFALFEVAPESLTRMVKLVAGRLPDQSDPDEILASYTLQRDNGVHLGSVIHVPLLAASQRAASLSDANVVPDGPTVALHVVGIEVSEFEFPATNTVAYDVYTTRAFARARNANTVFFPADLVQLRHGAADLPRFESSAKALGGLSVEDLDSAASAIDTSIHPQAVGWWLLALLAGLVGLMVVTQALVRQAAVEAEDQATLSALGVSRRQLVAVGLVRTLVIGVAGAIGGVGLAYLLSPLTPLGEARQADPAPGFAFDGDVLGLGALVAIIAVVVLGVWPAVRAGRIRNRGESAPVARPSRIMALMTGAGAPASMLIGVGHALERGRGRNAVPVGSALLGSVLAVTALCATAVFSSSLTHLTGTPALYGQPFAEWYSVNPTAPADENNAMVASIEDDHAISAITAGIGGDVTVDGKVVDALAGQSLRGPMLLTAVAGRLPRADGEVDLGATTMRQLGVHVGSLVKVTIPNSTASTGSSFRVVGSLAFPPDFGVGGLGTGAVFTLNGLLGGRCPPGPAQRACQIQAVASAQGAFLVRAVPGAAGTAALASLARAYPSNVSYPSPPTNLINFGEAVNFPLLFGLMLIIFGSATLVHVLVVSVVRRRREVGLLKAIGFVRQQVALSVAWQTTTVALVGIVIGIPVGLVVGRAVWRLFADNLGVLPVPVVIAWVIAAVAGGTVLVANLLAIGPALAAARSHTASLLKTE
jgi:ABC-type lipoprotein release transport system permease subunit